MSLQLAWISAIFGQSRNLGFLNWSLEISDLLKLWASRNLTFLNPSSWSLFEALCSSEDYEDMKLYESQGWIIWHMSLGLRNCLNCKVLVSDSKTRVSQSHKVSDWPFYTPVSHIFKSKKILYSWTCRKKALLAVLQSLEFSICQPYNYFNFERKIWHKTVIPTALQ